MNSRRLMLSLAGVVACLAFRAPALAADFGQPDLEKMVVQLDKVIPENPKFLYPVHCEIKDEDIVNAYATVRKEGDGLRSTMVVYTGLIKAIDGDQRLIRAVVAHEMSHLSRGHLVDIDPAARDLKNLWTRQQEFEADKYGAEALVKAGYARKDMVDMLLFLDRMRGRQGNWLDNLTGDHADPKARAAEVSDNPAALNALVTFDTALAYEDARSHLYARKLFEYAADQWPDLTEAYINAGRCALLFYYDNLPGAVRAKWWRPDFGPLITNPHAPLPQATEITDDDRQAWQEAMSAIQKANEKNPNSEDAKALLALAQVLQPDIDAGTVTKGIDWFTAQAASATDDVHRLRYANNAGVGLHQLGRLQDAYTEIMNAQRGRTLFNAALGENLGLVRVTGRSKDDDVLAANVLYTWLINTPESSSPRWNTVKSVFDEVCLTAGIKAKEITPKPAYLCQVTTLFDDHKELGLLLPVSGLLGLMGDPDQRITFASKWPDLTELRWHGGNFSVLTERGNVMRLTSRDDGSYLLLKPVDPTSQLVIQIKVGMSKADLVAALGEKSGVDKDLAVGGKTETWRYYSDLGIGVLVVGDKVTGITVTPVQYEAPAS